MCTVSEMACDNALLVSQMLDPYQAHCPHSPPQVLGWMEEQLDASVVYM